MNINIKDVYRIGFVNVKDDKKINYIKEINKLRKEKNAIILAHYYQESEIQDIADFVGDSLALSQQAANNNAEIIVFAGVHFMAETAKILSPEKKVIIPDLNAGCSLADSCKPEDFKKFKEKYPGYKVISYVNTTTEIKALTDVICTSTNAIKIVESFPKNEKLIFAPDRNLGNYINSITGRKMKVWDGACHVHEEFSLEKIMNLKKKYTNAKIIAHPECEKPILIVSDFIGSTSALLSFTKNDKAKEYIVATESGILHQMKKYNRNKLFIPAPPKDSTCACNDCAYMKLISLKKIYYSLKFEIPEIVIEEKLRKRAEQPIRKMLDISKKYGLV